MAWSVFEIGVERGGECWRVECGEWKVELRVEFGEQKMRKLGVLPR